jgi:hypothetical protein
MFLRVFGRRAWWQRAQPAQTPRAPLASAAPRRAGSRFGTEAAAMATVRKVVMLREQVFGELGEAAPRPVTRVAALAVVANPFAGRFVANLEPLWRLGAKLGDSLMEELASLLRAPAVSYGKGAIVGVNGEAEHGGACVHPMLGRPMRAAIGGGKAVIPSNVKVAAAGAALDLPLGHKDDPWSFAHFDTMTVSVADAPRPDEIVVALALADGGRLNNRCGDGPVTTG